jgi:hypothetical protein
MKRHMQSLITALLLCLSLAIPAVSVRAASSPLFPQRECTHPLLGFPTCYVQQPDGLWARQVLAETDATWMTVGTVTLDETVTAVGEMNATAP